MGERYYGVIVAASFYDPSSGELLDKYLPGAGLWVSFQRNGDDRLRAFGYFPKPTIDSWKEIARNDFNGELKAEATIDDNFRVESISLVSKLKLSA